MARPREFDADAAPIRALEPKAKELAGLLKKDRVDAALLTPV